MAKLDQPKEPILALIPLITAKAIVIAFKAKIKESLNELIVCSDSAAAE